MSPMTRLATTARWSDDDLVMPARVTIALFALVAALPAAHHPVQPATSAQSSAAQCPAYATLGTNGQPAVPLARVGAERLAPLETPTDLVVCRYRGTTVLQLTGSRRVGTGLVNAGTQLARSRRSTGGPGHRSAPTARPRPPHPTAPPSPPGLPV